MIDNSERYRPYGTTVSVISFCERARTRNLPEQIEDDFFRLAGIDGQAIRRTRHTLVFLGLLEDTNTPSSALRLLVEAPDGEWRNHLRQAVEAAYSEDLQHIDPANDDQTQVRSWFQRYQPRSQTNPMTTLFLGLCRESGMEVREPPRKRSPRQKRPDAPRATSGDTKPGRARRAEAATGFPQEPPSLPPSMPPAGSDLFDITPDVIAELSEQDFGEVWKALGVIARKRAQVIHARSADGESSGEESLAEDADE